MVKRHEKEPQGHEGHNEKIYTYSLRATLTVVPNWKTTNRFFQNQQDNQRPHIDETVKKWSVELTAGGRSFNEVKIQKGIFKGDALSPILFVIVLNSLEMHRRIQTYKIAGKYQSPKIHG